MPVTKQSIGFIGATSNIGLSLAQGVAHGNYRLLLFGRDSDEIEPIAKKIRGNTPNADIAILECAHECSWEADVIILDVSDNKLDEVLPNIRDVATQKIVVQLSSNPRREMENRTHIIEKIHRELPHSKIIHLGPTELLDSINESKKSGSLFISGDDNEAVQTVSEIIETAGFHPFVKNNIKEEI
ncbi:NAD(P)-binding domain-containing protein [Fodinibius sp. N2]|uniref:NAD(P)-binding domain-containing protein n=1 Tax=Fodinibius alkaliphilus TaxID=3140241 RepID=UPI00315AADA3